MIPNQTCQHFRMRLAKEDALQHDVVAVIERVSGGEIDEADGWIAGIILLPQDISTEHILADNRESMPESGTNLVGSASFPTGAIAADDDQRGSARWFLH